MQYLIAPPVCMSSSAPVTVALHVYPTFIFSDIENDQNNDSD